MQTCQRFWPKKKQKRRYGSKDIRKHLLLCLTISCFSENSCLLVIQKTHRENCTAVADRNLTLQISTVLRRESPNALKNFYSLVEFHTWTDLEEFDSEFK